MYRNRQDAAEKLADKLAPYAKNDCVVLAIPRGGVPIGYEISKRLQCPLDIVLSKKIGHPSNKEYAIGAVSLTDIITNLKVPVSNDYIETEAARIRRELQNTYHKYLHEEGPIAITGKTIILTDDGVATGHTLLSTVDLIRRNSPQKIVVAVPVSTPEALKKIEAQVDEVVCLAAPKDFRSVGQFYENFEQLSDEEVAGQLHERRLYDA